MASKEQITPVRQRKITPSNCDAVSSFQSGERVYVRSNGCWVLAVLKDISNERVVSLTNSGQEIVCERKDILHCTSVDTLCETRRLSDLSPLNEATVVHCLSARIETDSIYTRAGSTIVAINPFKDIADLYSLHTIHLYHNREHHENSAAPHIYEIAEEAYHRLHGDENNSQCIIVSGESGAGKTVSAKHLLRYLTVVANPLTDQTQQNKKLSECTGKGRAIERRILDSNPILEAFGNATTPRNDNSSRFGKFIQLQFHRSGHIQGASIETYLLEKTRVVHQGDGDCNFHIFYQLTNSQGSDHSWLSELGHQLTGHTFNIVPPNMEKKERQSLQTTVEAMTNVGLSETLQEEVFKVVAAILFLCNVDFTAMDEDFCSMSNESATCQATIQCCQLLGVSAENLEQVLLNRSIASGGDRRRSVFVKPVSIAEAKSRRDCLAMLLYSRLFDWLVNFINQQIQSENPANTIGLLDIYGFEMFDHNSLEQLCINYANEKLQQHYVRHFLKDLQREYEEERIAWQHIDYYDNQPCLDVLEGKVGVFGVLNEEVYLNRKSNPRVLGERVLEVSHKSAVVVKRPKTFTARPAFIIRHYAGDVQYNLEHVTNKNKDNIPVELVTLLQKSESSFLADLFTDFNAVEASGKKRKTVLTKFKASLDELLSTLKKSDVHYIRCIKPNRRSEAGTYDQPYVIQQLKASGVLETVEVCRRGYSSRLAYWDFLQRYGLVLREDISTPDKENVEECNDPVEILLQKHLSRSNTPRRFTTPQRVLRRRTGLSSLDHTRKCCAAVMTKVLGSQFLRSGALRDQFGKNKIFLLQEQFEHLECARNELRSRYAAVIQHTWRRFVLRRERRRRQAAGTIWRYWRRYTARRERARLVSAANCVQRAVSRWLFRVRVRKSLAAIRHHQTVIPGSHKLSDCVSESPERQNKRRRESTSDKITKNSISLKQNPTSKKRKSGQSDTMSSSSKKQNGTTSSRNSSSGKKRKSTGLLESETLNSEGKRSRTPFSSLTGQTADRGSGDNAPPEKKLKVSCSQYSQLADVHVGDGVVTRRKLAKKGMRFHTRESVLKNAHIVNRRELERGLGDCLLDD